jgi:hypothetical protein
LPRRKKSTPRGGSTNYLISHGITKATSKRKAIDRLLKIQPALDTFPYESPSKYFSLVWDAISSGRGFTRNMAGECFELIMACILLREGVVPFYMQAELEFVPDARFDILIFTNEIGPVALSLKTSLRERYKQAELEAISLKAVHRKSETYLITNNVVEARQNQKRLEEGVFIGICRVIVPQSRDLDDLIVRLKSFTPIQAGEVPIIRLPANGKLVT